jgi:hypothetical protein
MSCSLLRLLPYQAHNLINCTIQIFKQLVTRLSATALMTRSPHFACYLVEETTMQVLRAEASLRMVVSGDPTRKPAPVTVSVVAAEFVWIMRGLTDETE